MQFGKVSNPDLVDFSLPPDHPGTGQVLNMKPHSDDFNVFVGCAKWNRSDLKGFYPRGTKDELAYYSQQFNSIEMNATFYRIPDWSQVESWKKRTSDHFRFFPKLTNSISHYHRLINVQPLVEEFCDAVSVFEDKLGTCFLQLHENFTPEYMDRLQNMLEHFPDSISLAVEVRNEKWFSDKDVFDRYSQLLEKLNMDNIIVDTAGRRDMLHMRLTTPTAFVRYVGANHHSDIGRLDDWVERIMIWREQGLENLYFFVHQNVELESPLLAAHFIKRLNERLGLSLSIPARPGADPQQSLF